MTEVAKPADGVRVTIDGFEMTVPKGTLIIRAAEQLGIQIPRFCDHPLLAPIGACRQCLVQVEGQPKPPASCTTVCTDGMVVRTQLTSPVAEKAQRGVMEMLLVNHPLDCPMCDKGGECPLQNQAMTAGQGETRFNGQKRTFAKPIALSAQVLLDRERCVQCARCTQVRRPDRRGPADRPVRARPAGTGRSRRGRAVRLLLLRQHRADLPGRRADGYVLPVPGPPVRPGLDAERLRALRVRVPAADRPPARRRHAQAGGQRSRGERGVELRQGPLGLHLRDPARPAGLRRWSGMPPECCSPRPGRRRSTRPLAAWPRPEAGQAC